MISINLVLLVCSIAIVAWSTGVSIYTYFSLEKNKPSFAEAGRLILWGAAVTAILFILIILIFKL